MTIKMDNVADVWVVWVSADLFEGKGPRVPKHVCEKETTARRLAKGADTQGTDGGVTKERIYLPEGSYQWYGPIAIVRPTRQDLVEQDRLETMARLQAEKDAAIQAARGAGLTEVQIAALMRPNTL